MSLDEILKPVQPDLARVEEDLERFLRSDLRIADEVGRFLARTRGKRIRPALTLLASRASGYRGTRAAKAAVAVELIHTATLVHDDLVDRSSRRRGVPTVNARWGDSISVLMGDLLFSKAFELLRETPFQRVSLRLIQAAHQMSHGELRQTESKGSLDIREKDYLAIIQEKTASLFSAAAECGAYFGSQAHEAPLARFGLQWGTAFQIVDDVFDFVGDSRSLGKPIALDVREGKITLPLIYALQHAPQKEAARARTIIKSKHILDGGFEDIARFAKEWGGIEYALGRARAATGQARLALKSLPRSPAKDTLYELTDYVLSRSC
jgi:octaprenyl-diphosphate synthase